MNVGGRPLLRILATRTSCAPTDRVEPASLAARRSSPARGSQAPDRPTGVSAGARAEGRWRGHRAAISRGPWRLCGTSDPSAHRASKNWRSRNGVPPVARKQASTVPIRNAQLTPELGTGTVSGASRYLGCRVGRHGAEQLGVGSDLASRSDDERDIELFVGVTRKARHQRDGKSAQWHRRRPRRADRRHRSAQPVEAVEDRERWIDVQKAARRQRGAGSSEQAPPRRQPLRRSARSASMPRRVRLEELTHDSEGEIALQLRSPRTKHAHAALRSGRPRGPEQRRLADPGRPFDYQEPAAPCAGLGKRRLDLRQFLAPLEQRFRGRGTAHRRRAYSPPEEKSGVPRCESRSAPSSIKAIRSRARSRPIDHRDDEKVTRRRFGYSRQAVPRQSSRALADRHGEDGERQRWPGFTQPSLNGKKVRAEGGTPYRFAISDRRLARLPSDRAGHQPCPHQRGFAERRAPP